MNALKERVKQIIEENGGATFAQDVLNHGCISGVVTEMIYYKDTHAWFDTYYDEIQELAEQYELETGEKLHWNGDLKNWFAWFSFERITFELYA
ncbi:hypothetical protein [Bacillus licheniformis]|uniref:DUF7222 domain-containing protein n=1 Tax=Bacillus licheniformis TaxID=1402 RepID=UPI002E200756|nr:hypothetical protein [Bacillus licheniformis]